MSTFTSNKGFILQLTGENPNTWGTLLNNDIFSPLDTMIGGQLSLSVAGSSNVTLNAAQAQNGSYIFTGALTGSIQVIWPATQANGLFFITNSTTGAFTLTVIPSGGAGVAISQGAVQVPVWNNGSTMTAIYGSPSIGAGPRSYLAGLTLSNDGVTPNSVLDIAAGTCADSTNTVSISLGVFTKTTGGSWTAGSGAIGMGTGLTIANSTWYHVFAIINAGAADIYFDTSVTASNKPSGTTAFRRLGSFLTDTSAHIVAFSQNGNEFLWLVPSADATSVGITTSASNQGLGVPAGIVVNALFRASFIATSAADTGLLISSLSEGNNAAGNPNNSLVSSYIAANSSAVTTAGAFNIRTNTSSQIRVRGTGNGSYSVATNGWIDTRGRDA